MSAPVKSKTKPIVLFIHLCYLLNIKYKTGTLIW